MLCRPPAIQPSSLFAFSLVIPFRAQSRETESKVTYTDCKSPLLMNPISAMPKIFGPKLTSSGLALALLGVFPLSIAVADQDQERANRCLRAAESALDKVASSAPSRELFADA